MAKTPLEIASLARMHTKKAVKTLAAIMNEPHAPYAARVAAAEGPARVAFARKARGVRFGRPRTLTPHQRQEAMQRLAEGEVQADLATHCVAGHVGLELRNPCASHVFEMS
jgi:hypothetical protein